MVAAPCHAETGSVYDVAAPVTIARRRCQLLGSPERNPVFGLGAAAHPGVTGAYKDRECLSFADVGKELDGPYDVAPPRFAPGVRLLRGLT